MIHKIVTDICKVKDFEAVCKNLAKDGWEDLWHDVILQLYEKEELIIKANNGGYLKNYVIAIICQVFNSKCRNEKKNPVSLYQLIDFFDSNEYYEEFNSWWQEKEYSFFKRTEAEERAAEVTKEAVNEVTKMMMNGDSGAMILWQASQTNVYTVSRRLGTSSYQVNKTIKPIIKQIKRKLK